MTVKPLSLEADAAMSDSNEERDSIHDTVILPLLALDLEFIQAPNLNGNFIHFKKKNKYISCSIAWF